MIQVETPPINFAKNKVNAIKQLEKQIKKLKAEIKALHQLNYTPADKWDAEDFLLEKKISNHPRVVDCDEKESYEVADLMSEFANRYYGSTRLIYKVTIKKLKNYKFVKIGKNK